MAAGAALARISAPKSPKIQPFAPALQMWEVRGQELAREGKAQQWGVADWLLAGCELLYSGKEMKKATGVYDKAEKLFGYSRGTLIQFAYVARAFPESIRIDSLSFGHHQAAMGAPEDMRIKWLHAAAKSKTSIAEFRKMIKKDNVQAKASVADKFSLPILPESDLKKLELLAKVQDTSVAAIATEAIGGWLRKNGRKLRAAQKALDKQYKAALKKKKEAEKIAAVNLKKAKVEMLRNMKKETIVARSWQGRLKKRVENVMVHTAAHSPAAFIAQFDKLYGADVLPMHWVMGNTLFAKKKSWKHFVLADYTKEEERKRQTNCQNEHRQIMGQKEPPTTPSVPPAPLSAKAVAVGAGFDL